MAASAHGPDPDTVIFRAQTPSGVEEEIVVQLDSESKWQAWVGAGMGTRLEVETTRALAADESAEKEFGILTALNDARAVTFVHKGEPGNNHPARGGRALPQQQVGGAERGEGHPLFLRRQRPDKARPLAQAHPSLPGRLRDQASRSQAAA